MRVLPCIFLAVGLLTICETVPPSPAALQGEEKDSSVFIDASKETVPPEPLSFSVGGKSPSGHVLGANSRYLTLDGAPWFPVMGEFHFSRYPESGWEEEILKMKAGGIQIVSTYAFWIHHEEIEGQFDWSGRRDLRRFIQLCAKHGMYVWIRVGPWAHGEVRNGGLPDWLVAHYPVRQNDPDYLRFVRRLYGQIGRQVKDLFWKDGGPIIGVQIENEYHERGPGKGVEHILTLLQLARDAGLDAPFYTETAWDAAEVPSQQILPVFGGYADAFWSRSLKPLPPNANFFFSSIRCDENIGDDLRSKRPDLDQKYASYPFLTAEMGGGMELAYHRRPLMNAEDTAAMAVVKLGSGVTLYGYYMFHGGTNPEGKLTTLQESQATGYPNDLPVKSYDFQAPLGEFGQMNPSFRELKSLHLFLHDFGAVLAPMTAHFPAVMPQSKLDTATPRVAARVEGNRGFIFINNYQRTYPLPERKNFQVELKLSSETIVVPRRPVDIPSGAYPIWPVNLPIGGAVLEYATAQLLCKLEELNTFVFFEWPGVPAEFAFRAGAGESIETFHARRTREQGLVFVDGIQPGQKAVIRIRDKAGKDTQVLVLSREMAKSTWKATLNGRERLLLSSADLYFEENHVHLRSSDPAQLNFEIFPKLERVPSGFTAAGRDGFFFKYATHVAATNVSAVVEKQEGASPQPPVSMGREVATAPKETAFDGAARWSIHIPPIQSTAVRKVFLRISYAGDVARVYEAGQFLTDNFFNGAPWEVGLGTPSAPASPTEVELRILPLREDAPIYLPPGARPIFPADGQVSQLKDVQILLEYEAVANLDPRR
ncbi:MAG: beta-galactosidase [Candidatus Acidiferrum sp.]